MIETKTCESDIVSKINWNKLEIGTGLSYFIAIPDKSKKKKKHRGNKPFL